MDEPIFYVGIAAKSATAAAEKCVTSGADTIVHVYVKAADSVYANGAALDLCRERNLEFRAFTYLASEESEATLHPGEEHRTAFKFAEQCGLAYVTATMFDGAHCRIGMPQFDT